MLARSRKSAFVLAVVFATTALIVAGIIVAVRYLTGTLGFEAAENAAGGGGNNAIEPIIALALSILVVGSALVMLSLGIYRGDDSHFGFRGAIRWAVTGAVYGILIQPASVLLSRSDLAGSAWLAALFQVLGLGWAGLMYELSYRLVFKWIPLTRDPRARQPDKSREGQVISVPPTGRKPVTINEGLAIIRQNPEARLAAQAISWFIIGGSIIMLIIGLVTPKHPNPHLLPSLVVIALGGLVTGAAMLLSLRQSRMAPWFMLLSCALFVIVLYMLVRVFTYSL